MEFQKLPPLTSSATLDAPKAPSSVSPPRKEAGVKETVQSILVAFILAFVFRAFVVEAFVIPTGSMGPTLLGAHMRFTCTECNHAFEANYSAQSSSGDEMHIPDRATVMVNKREVPRVFAAFCNNCGKRVPRENADNPANSATAPPVSFGDRILVLKYLYQFTDPQRWDVVVFKSPADPKYQTNYIKRLIGNPNESIVVLDGDIYIGKPEQDVSQYQVQPKPRHAQESLWRLVYDNDFKPKDAGQKRFARNAKGTVTIEDPTWHQPWKQSRGGAGWDTSGDDPAVHRMKFDNLTGGSTIAFEPNLEMANHPLTSWLAYNATMRAFEADAPSPDVHIWQTADNYLHVSDLKLQFFYQRHQGDGPLRVVMSKYDRTFIAELLPDRVRLLERAGEAETVLAEQPLSPPGRPVRVEFANVDYRLNLRIDDRDVLTHAYQPDMTTLLKNYRTNTYPPRPTIELSAAKQSATLQHVSLWRDVYYLNRDRNGSRLRWATPDQPVHLGQDEYFVLGDNSSHSLDARYWTDPIRLPDEDLDVASGRVPGRFMLGKAFFVYWPAGHKPAQQTNINLVPNFGQMRAIH